jgi:hypothetical protein
LDNWLTRPTLTGNLRKAYIVLYRKVGTCKYLHEYDNIPDHLYDFVVKNTSTETANKLFKNDKLWLNQDECLDMKIIDVILL